MEQENKTSQKSATGNLFRKEVLENQRISGLGKVMISAPISFSVWSGGLFFCALALGLFLCFGKYTKRQEVYGVLVPDKGVVNAYAKRTGVITKAFVQQGDQVSESQLLFLVSTVQHDLTDNSLSAQQVQLLAKQVEIQKNKLAISRKNLALHKNLFDQRLLSELEYRQYHDAHLGLQQSLYDLEQRLNELKGGSSYTIRAPSKGIISVLAAVPGDRVTENSLLTSIVPEGSILQGVLYVPTEAFGFIRLGQKVLLKYHAYPYQQFGLYESTVSHIEQSTLTPQDLKVPFNLNSPFYRVTVTLKQQTIPVFGESRHLVPGMLFSATILNERRSILQWILGPIYNLKNLNLS
jgi:membrane fusion protein